jgi:hypothetical protein
MFASVNQIKKGKSAQAKLGLGLDLGCVPPQPGFLDPPPGELDPATMGTDLVTEPSKL